MFTVPVLSWGPQQSPVQVDDEWSGLSKNQAHPENLHLLGNAPVKSCRCVVFLRQRTGRPVVRLERSIGGMGELCGETVSEPSPTRAADPRSATGQSSKLYWCHLTKDVEM